jgi:hypothetical protein
MLSSLQPLFHLSDSLRITCVRHPPGFVAPAKFDRHTGRSKAMRVFIRIVPNTEPAAYKLIPTCEPRPEREQYLRCELTVI